MSDQLYYLPKFNNNKITHFSKMLWQPPPFVALSFHRLILHSRIKATIPPLTMSITSPIFRDGRSHGEHRQKNRGLKVNAGSQCDSH